MLISVEELEKKLIKNELDSLYLFFGEENFLIESAIKKIKKLFGILVPGINFISIDESNLKEIIANLDSPAFGYNKKLIIIKNSGILRKDGKKKNQELVEQKDKIAKYINENLEMIQSSAVIIFIEEDVENKDLYKIIESSGIVCKFEYQKPIQIGKRIKSICNGYKINIDDTTIRYFMEVCGTSMQELINEIRKLIEYVGENGEITKNDINMLATKQIQAIIFDLTDSLGKKDAKTALMVFNNLIYSKEPIQKILITLYNHFKKLYITKLSENCNKNLAQSLNLKPNQMFLANKYKMQSTYFSKTELREILEQLIYLDTNYKIGLIDLDTGLQSILCKYCS